MPASIRNIFRQPFNRVAKIDAEGNIRISPKQIYIIPTRFGLIYACMVIAMFLGSNNYELNLGFVLTFLLTGIGLSAMIQTWKNLVRLEIAGTAVDNTFCGDPAEFCISIHNNRNTNRSGLQFFIEQESGVFDLPGHGTQRQCCPVTTEKRGFLNPQRWTVCSYFPTGLFYSWAYFQTQQRCLVYPKPSSPDIPLDQLFSTVFTDQLNAVVHSDNVDFFGHRKYQIGDNLKRLDWKALARGRGKLVKQFREAESPDLWLRWDEVLASGLEEKLSVLCRAILELSDRNILFGLDIPGTLIQPNAGQTHKIECLSSLAMFNP